MMNTAPRIKALGRTAAFTRTEWLMALGIVVVFVLFAAPDFQDCHALVREQMITTLQNARQLHLATESMTRDNLPLAGDHVHWTSGYSGGKPTAITAREYFDALVRGGYLSEQDLQKYLTAPGRGPGKDAPTAENSCFKFFRVDDASPKDQPLMVTANWDHRQLTPGSVPYATKGFVVFTKEGSGGVYSRVTDAASTNVFPVGHAYSYEVLK